MINSQYLISQTVGTNGKPPKQQACLSRPLSSSSTKSVRIYLQDNVGPPYNEWYMKWCREMVQDVWKPFQMSILELDAVKNITFGYSSGGVSALADTMYCFECDTTDPKLAGPWISFTGCMLRYIKEQPGFIETMYNFCERFGVQPSWELFFLGHRQDPYWGTTAGHRAIHDTVFHSSAIPPFKLFEELTFKQWNSFQRNPTYVGTTVTLRAYEESHVMRVAEEILNELMHGK